VDAANALTFLTREDSMPGPIRKPLTHPAQAQLITPRSIMLFERMKRIRCTCDPDERFDECLGCKEWLELDEQIGLELKAPIWEYPCLERPGATNPYPRSHANYTWWENRDPGPRERWIALEQAAREMRRQERAARHTPQPPSPSPKPPPSP
jgi:hypothetical protein